MSAADLLYVGKGYKGQEYKKIRNQKLILVSGLERKFEINISKINRCDIMSTMTVFSAILHDGTV